MSIDEKLDLVLQGITELLAIVKPAPALVEKLDLSREEVMAQLGFEPGETKQFYQVAWRIKLKPYRQKHYRRQDVVEAVARAAFLKRKSKR